MTNTTFEFIAEIILSFIEYPGALIHWLFLKKKVPFKIIIKKHYSINLLLSLLLYALFGYIIYQIIQ